MLRRFFIFLPVLALGIAALGYTLIWHATAARAERQFADWAAAARNAGLDVSYRIERREGYPFRLQYQVVDLVVSETAGGRTVTLQAPAMQLNVLPYSAGHLIANLPETARLLLAASGPAGDVRLSAADAKGSLVGARAGRTGRLAVDLGDLTLSRGAGMPDIAIARVQLHKRPPVDGAADLYLRAEGLSAPQGGAIDTLSLAGRGAGGSALTLSIDALEAAGKAHRLSADGNLALNGDLALTGTLAVPVADLPALERLLADLGLPAMRAGGAENPARRIILNARP